MSEAPTPEKVKELASNLFKREIELDVKGVKFKLRRMTLKEELEWYEFRDKTLKDENIDANDKIVKIWEELLQRCIMEPKCSKYTEELPGPVIAFLIDVITELHLWNMDFRGLRRASS